MVQTFVNDVEAANEVMQQKRVKVQKKKENLLIKPFTACGSDLGLNWAIHEFIRAAVFKSPLCSGSVTLLLNFVECQTSHRPCLQVV